MRAAEDNVLRKADPGRKLAWCGMSCLADIASSYRIQDTGKTDTRRLVVGMPIVVWCIGERT